LFRRFCLGTTGDRTGRSKAKHMLCIAFCIFSLTSSSSLLSPRADARGGVGSPPVFPDRGASLGPSGRSALLDPGLPHLRYRICEIAFASSLCGVLQTVSCQLTWWVCCCTGEPYLSTCQWHSLTRGGLPLWRWLSSLHVVSR
jgi:hypothetical protein